MYSERDWREINGRIRGNLMALAPVAAAILAAYVAGLALRVEWLARVAGPLLFVAVCYGVLAYLLPNLRYRRFLADMREGLSRELRGVIAAVSDAPEAQDGVRVLPVRLRLDADGDERIVYLNASKAEGFPPPGTAVALTCFGRHIRAVTVVDGTAERNGL